MLNAVALLAIAAAAGVFKAVRSAAGDVDVVPEPPRGSHDLFVTSAAAALDEQRARFTAAETKAGQLLTVAGLLMAGLSLWLPEDMRTPLQRASPPVFGWFVGILLFVLIALAVLVVSSLRVLKVNHKVPLRRTAMQDVIKAWNEVDNFKLGEAVALFDAASRLEKIVEKKHDALAWAWRAMIALLVLVAALAMFSAMVAA